MDNPRLCYILATGFAHTEKRRIIAAGPLTKQPSTKPFRIVLVAWETKYSVHTEYFEEVPQTNFAASYLEDGDYYRDTAEGFVSANRKFAERIIYHSQFVGSIYRDYAAEEDK